MDCSGRNSAVASGDFCPSPIPSHFCLLPPHTPTLPILCSLLPVPQRSENNMESRIELAWNGINRRDNFATKYPPSCLLSLLKAQISCWNVALCHFHSPFFTLQPPATLKARVLTVWKANYCQSHGWKTWSMVIKHYFCLALLSLRHLFPLFRCSTYHLTWYLFGIVLNQVLINLIFFHKIISVFNVSLVPIW